jgi:tripartite-type tricarboxylate transporter receptor subunit TctC
VETCPKCGTRFNPPEAGGGYATLTILRGGALDTKVRCLDCGHVFQPRAGLIGPRILKFVIGSFVAIAVVVLMYVLVFKPLVHAQGFPARPVTVVVPFPPGGSADFLARVLADPLGERWGKPLLVANRPGAGTVIGTESVAKAPGDGHTLLMNAASFVINAAVRPNLPYDILRDFAPVTLLVYSPQVFVVNSSSSIKTLQDLLAAARAKPGQLSYATVGPATTQHVLGEQFKLETKIDVIYAPYPGGAPAVTALLGNHVHFVIANYNEVATQVAAGKLRAIATASRGRIEQLKDIPTLIESGVDIETTVWFGIVAPAGSPKSAIDKLQADIAAALKLPAVREKLIAQGMFPVGSTPEDFAAHIRAQKEQYEKVIKQARIKAD